ncbi:MAG: BA14K family protein [Mesorhizobium sp.]|nr:BA14K family protein [bacterium M00.F.Ca.ET.205.01.1.1]TGU52910.1 BA14K family protein [bacterium M00.F.Ca.ET.152.01.1.1]TGV36161.1 BA14K family protein [Mesorhizobium sp. M00.F.Ca.ET.186.01.1.1]TGZ43462.1 BA14K family protein [bacterium M00.F.Ca.ET.162.01.1.1]TJW31790.1 MAG: BA14K family protein [Mesorhizobium sp.]
MNSLFSSSVKSGLIALGILSGITAPSAAGPILQPNLSIPTSAAAPAITPVRDEWAGGNDRQLNDNWRWRRSGHWNRGGNWNGGNWDRGNWNRGNWNQGDSWRWRRHHYRGRYHDDAAGAAILGLGLGLGLGSMYNNYNYYDVPAPRRYYRAGRLSNAHVQWCYNRYRSYRSWDNTFQPYNGPRQQCWSPYS